jgi:hypothetical protein
MAEHGGYRRPTNPAPVSGPGAHSRRTDGQPMVDLPDAQYGENAAFQEAQAGAKISNSGVQAAAQQGAQMAVTPLGAPTTAPERALRPSVACRTFRPMPSIWPSISRP